MTETVPEWLWVWRPSGLQWDDIVSASQCYRPGDGREVVKYVPATALEAAQARIVELEAEKREAALQYLADAGQLSDALATARREALEEAAKVIEDHSEWVRSTDNSRNVQPRTEGDRLGLGYAAAIRALMEKEHG